MFRRVLAAMPVVLCFCNIVVCPVSADEAPHTMVISGAKILDQSGERLLEDKDLLIADGKIEGIGSSGELQIPRAATRVDATGLTLVPGLMDLHTHLLIGALTEDGATDRELFEAYTKQVVQESIPRRTIRAVVAARVTLEAGFTTVRDVCTEGAQYADVALRDSIREGIIPGPRIFASTRGIAATGCYMPLGFDRRFEVTQSAQVADGEDQIRQAVREQVARGADLIKVFADFPRSGWRMTPCFTQDELNALVDEARTAGVSVAAHAMTDEGIRRCVLAGVRTIEHGTFASAESLRLMQDHGVALCPTLMAGTREEGMTLIQRARDADVTIVCGSDAGEYPHGQNARELGLLVEYGLSPAEALRAATVSAAEVLELSDRLGRIAPGYIADIVAVRGNPLKDISVLRKPIVVIKDGKVHLDRS